MERKNPFLSGIVRCICFLIGALLLIGLYAWRISNIIEEKQEMAEKSQEELIESYFSPSGIHGWDEIAEGVSVNFGRWSDDQIITHIEVVRDRNVYQYYGYYDKDSSSETGIVYDGLGMERCIEDTYAPDIEELTIFSRREEKEIEVYAAFADKDEFYIVSYEDGAYVSNFKMEKDIKMSVQELASLNEGSRQVLEEILYERWDRQQQVSDKMKSSTVCFAILMIVWALIMMSFHQMKKPIEEER